MLLKLIDAYKHFRPISDAEAWFLFREAAFAEAIGWTMLIIGIACKHLPVGWHEAPVQIAGRIHGVLFLLYLLAVVLVSPSLGWSWWRILLAGACSAPPFGSLLFERWAAHDRDWTGLQALHGLTMLQRIQTMSV